MYYGSRPDINPGKDNIMDGHYDNKIKTFRFTVSNAASTNLPDDQNNKHFRELATKIATPEIIDKTINDFLAGRILVDIKSTTVDIHYHNNARGNTIDMIYTVIYRNPTSHVTVKNEITM